MKVGFVGRLQEPKKGVFVLLIAAQKCPDHRFYIVGDGPDRLWLEAYAQSRKIWNVEFLGSTNNPDFTQFDVIVVPSLWEGFCLVVLEAMKAGVPVVASNVGGIPEIIRDQESGMLFHPDDPDDLKAVIEYLDFFPQYREQMRHKGRERAKAFDIKFTIAGLERIYHEVLRS